MRSSRVCEVYLHLEEVKLSYVNCEYDLKPLGLLVFQVTLLLGSSVQQTTTLTGPCAIPEYILHANSSSLSLYYLCFLSYKCKSSICEYNNNYNSCLKNIFRHELSLHLGCIGFWPENSFMVIHILVFFIYIYVVQNLINRLVKQIILISKLFAECSQ